MKTLLGIGLKKSFTLRLVLDQSLNKIEIETNICLDLKQNKWSHRTLLPIVEIDDLRTPFTESTHTMPELL